MPNLGFAAVRTDPVESWWLARRDGPPRRMARLSARDTRRWHRLGGRVARAVEPRLDRAVLANRVRWNAGGWELRPLAPDLAAARRAAGRLVPAGGTLLRTDVAAFYSSVTPSALAGILRRSGVGRDVARTAADLVEGWGASGSPGLPVGPEASAVMANAVLHDVDGAVVAFPFLRWVDDYLVALPTERAAAEALDRLDLALERLGLRRNAAKTAVLGEALGWLGLSGGAVRGRSCGSAAPGCPRLRGP